MRVTQLIYKKKRLNKKTKVNSILSTQPFIRGSCIRVFTVSPRKPNSAIRKVAKVFLSNSKTILAYIPGEGHNLMEHSTVLVRGGNVNDLPGINFKVVRGVYDCEGVAFRKTSRSKYGAKLKKQT